VIECWEEGTLARVAFVPSLAAVFLNLRKLSQVLAGRTIHVFLGACLENVIVVLLVSHRRKKYWQKPYAYYPMGLDLL